MSMLASSNFAWGAIGKPFAISFILVAKKYLKRPEI
jgi:hypothetical protein